MTSPSPLDGVQQFALQVIPEARGTLVVCERGPLGPLKIRRIFYVADVPPGAIRGQHAHRRTVQVVMAAAGSFRLELTDGRRTQSFEMNNPSKAVLIPPLVWDKLSDFSVGAICLVLASELYDTSDYIRDWEEFLRLQPYGQP